MDKISLFHGQKFAISEFSQHIEYDFLKEDHKNKTQYDWFPERVKIQRSLVQNLSKIQQRLKIIGCFLTFWEVKIPRITTFGGQSNMKNEFSTVEILSVQIFSKI